LAGKKNFMPGLINRGMVRRVNMQELELIKSAFEILIGAFAGYCGCYFISMKLVKKTPEQVLQLYFERLEKKLTQKP
jgi:hypothetical protein